MRGWCVSGKARQVKHASLSSSNERARAGCQNLAVRGTFPRIQDFPSLVPIRVPTGTLRRSKLPRHQRCAATVLDRTTIGTACTPYPAYRIPLASPATISLCPPPPESRSAQCGDRALVAPSRASAAGATAGCAPTRYRSAPGGPRAVAARREPHLLSPAVSHDGQRDSGRQPLGARVAIATMPIDRHVAFRLRPSRGPIGASPAR